MYGAELSIKSIRLNNYQKRQGRLGNVETRRFVFTHFQADNYGTP